MFILLQLFWYYNYGDMTKHIKHVCRWCMVDREFQYELKKVKKMCLVLHLNRKSRKLQHYKWMFFGVQKVANVIQRENEALEGNIEFSYMVKNVWIGPNLSKLKNMYLKTEFVLLMPYLDVFLIDLLVNLDFQLIVNQNILLTWFIFCSLEMAVTWE